MARYDGMVEKNRAKSMEKEKLAITLIRNLEKDGEPIVICDLVRKTGLSRSFFYSNERVKEELERVLEKQRAVTYRNPRREIFDRAMEQKILLLERQVERLERENERLKRMCKI